MVFSPGLLESFYVDKDGKHSGVLRAFWRGFVCEKLGERSRGNDDVFLKSSIIVWLSCKALLVRDVDQNPLVDLFCTVEAAICRSTS